MRESSITVVPMEFGAIALFAFVASITPGPNNVMLWASGLDFGFRRTIPHLAGINIGFISLLLATSVGLGSLFERVSWMSVALRVVGSAYLATWRTAWLPQDTLNELTRPSRSPFWKQQYSSA